MADTKNILYVLTTSKSPLLVLALFVLALLMMPAYSATDFPVAPVDASAADAGGLQQLDMAALRKAFTGTHVEQDARGKIYRAQYGADGSVILSNSSGLIDRGTFTVIRQHGGGVCLRLEHQMNQRMCSVWFFAQDGIHLFGYNPADGSLRAVSRPGVD